MPSEYDDLATDLRGKGYTGSLADMQYAYLQAKVGPLPQKSFADLLRLYSGPKRGGRLDTPVESLSAFIASDDFTAADATTFAGRTTPVGAKAWVSSGNWQVMSNKAVPTLAGETYTNIDVGVANFTIEVDMRTGPALANSGIMCKFIDDSTRIELRAEATGWKIRRLVGYGSDAGASGGAPAINTDYHIKVTIVANVLTVFINGVNTLTYNIVDAGLQASTKCGLFCAGTGTADTWDNFTVAP